MISADVPSSFWRRVGRQTLQHRIPTEQKWENIRKVLRNDYGNANYMYVCVVNVGIFTYREVSQNSRQHVISIRHIRIYNISISTPPKMVRKYSLNIAFNLLRFYHYGVLLRHFLMVFFWGKWKGWGWRKITANMSFYLIYCIAQQLLYTRNKRTIFASPPLIRVKKIKSPLRTKKKKNLSAPALR